MHFDELLALAALSPLRPASFVLCWPAMPLAARAPVAGAAQAPTAPPSRRWSCSRAATSWCRVRGPVAGGGAGGGVGRCTAKAAQLHGIHPPIHPHACAYMCRRGPFVCINIGRYICMQAHVHACVRLSGFAGVAVTRALPARWRRLQATPSPPWAPSRDSRWAGAGASLPRWAEL